MTPISKPHTLLCRATKTATSAPLRQPSLWALEHGKTKTIKADTLFRIAAALGANPQWIKDGTGEPFAIGSAPGDDETIQKYLALSPERKAMIAAAIKAIT